jgi:thioredoxin 1
MSAKPRALAACLGLLACAILASLSAGCNEDPSLVTSNNSNMIFLDGPKEFEQKVLQCDKPVMVDFFKGSCPTCVLEEAWLNELAEEYKGRVVFARMRIMTETFTPTCPEFKDKYQLWAVPTEALFVNGQEKQRWIFNHLKEEFREAINDALLEQSRPKGVGAQPPVSAAAPVTSVRPAAAATAGRVATPAAP